MATVKFSLEEGIHEMDALLASAPDQKTLFDKGSSYLEHLIQNPEAIPEEYRRPLGRGPGPATVPTSYTEATTAPTRSWPGPP